MNGRPSAGPATAAGPSPDPADRVELPADAVEVGRVVGAWGIQGGFKVKPFAADPQALFSSRRWYLSAPAAVRGVAAWPQLLRIAHARGQGDLVVARAHDVDDREAAEALRGAGVWVPRSSFPTPDEGEYYWVDLIGLAVFDRAGRCLGRVRNLIETGPHCVLEIHGDESAAPAPVLIPFVDAYVDRVDREAGRIDVDWASDDD